LIQRLVEAHQMEHQVQGGAFIQCDRSEWYMWYERELLVWLQTIQQRHPDIIPLMCRCLRSMAWATRSDGAPPLKHELGALVLPTLTWPTAGEPLRAPRGTDLDLPCGTTMQTSDFWYLLYFGSLRTCRLFSGGEGFVSISRRCFFLDTIWGVKMRRQASWALGVEPNSTPSLEPRSRGSNPTRFWRRQDYLKATSNGWMLTLPIITHGQVPYPPSFVWGVIISIMLWCSHDPIPNFVLVLKSS
jgi:hypothetical protein